MLLISLFLLKPYIIAIASIAYIKDRSAIINLFYTDKIFISLEAMTAIPLLILIYAWTRREPGASNTIKNIWHRGKLLIITSATLMFCVTSSPLWLPTENRITNIDIIYLVLYTLVIIITYFSRYMMDCFADFPVNNDEK